MCIMIMTAVLVPVLIGRIILNNGRGNKDPHVRHAVIVQKYY